MDEIYIEYEMCKMYKCTPTDLDEQDERRVEAHWHLHNAIARASNEKSKSKK